MKINSRATNLRHLQDALANLAATAAAERTSPPTPSPPPSKHAFSVLTAAYRALSVGATPREIAAAALLTREELKTLLYQAHRNGVLTNRSA